MEYSKVAEFAMIESLNNIILIETNFLNDVCRSVETKDGYFGWKATRERKKFVLGEQRSSLEQFVDDIPLENRDADTLSEIKAYIKLVIEELNSVWEPDLTLEGLTERVERVIALSYFAFVHYLGEDHLRRDFELPIPEKQMVMIATSIIKTAGLSIEEEVH